MRMQLLDDNLVSTLGKGKKCLRLENRQDIEIWGKEQGVQHGHAVSMYVTSMYPVRHKTVSHGLCCPQRWTYHKVLITIKRSTFAGTENEGLLMRTLALTIVMSYFSVEKLTFSWEITSGKAQLQGPPEWRPPGGTGSCWRQLSQAPGLKALTGFSTSWPGLHLHCLTAMQIQSTSDMRQGGHRWTEICPHNRNRLPPSSGLVNNEMLQIGETDGMWPIKTPIWTTNPFL